MDRDLGLFFDSIDDIDHINLLNHDRVDSIIDTIRSDVSSILVVEIVWDGWYDKAVVQKVPRTIQQAYRYAEHRPWRYYVFDFGDYKKLSIGAFGGSGPRENDRYFSRLLSEDCLQNKIEKHSIGLKDVLSYFDAHASR